jgi:hypothetical protein
MVFVGDGIDRNRMNLEFGLRSPGLLNLLDGPKGQVKGELEFRKSRVNAPGSGVNQLDAGPQRQ